MPVTRLLEKLASSPETVEFDEVISAIKSQYDYSAASFTNGDAINEAGSNEGSCKIFAFAKLNDLNEAQTLACFGKYYRHDVLENPDGEDHANIRNFMQHGWAGINFEKDALTVK